MEKISEGLIRGLFKPREAGTHKGSHGHVMLLAGSKGKMGACIIASKACLRAGAGLLTVYVEADERAIVQTAIPEAMVVSHVDTDGLDRFSALGVGPGLGTAKDIEGMLFLVLNRWKKPLVLDADALNILSTSPHYLYNLAPGAILTPHPIEFDRLFGQHENEEERRHKALQVSRQYPIVIVLKGPQTLVAFNGEGYLNTTGNAGLAKGGSGDALLGIITAFVAQGYPPLDAARLGVYLHGKAADVALEQQSMESMLITDVIECLGRAFKSIQHFEEK
ncbi:MAG: NAD(P)H-hydrate dehydratase [Chitinophagaceae bacterium]